MLHSKSPLFALVFAVTSIHATTYFADASANNNGPADGSASNPFNNMADCINAIRQAGDVCELRAGIYQAGGALAVSGNFLNPVIIRARPGDLVVVRQGADLKTWQNDGTGMWSLDLQYQSHLQFQRSITTHYERGIQLWREAKPLTEACFPNLPTGGTGMHPTIDAEAGTSRSVLRNSRIPSGDLRGARAVVYPFLRNNAETVPVLSSGAGSVTIDATFNDMEPGKPFYLEGAKALIDQDWEWAWDAPTGKLWIKPPANVNPNTAGVRLQNSAMAFLLANVTDVRIEGIRFEGVVPVANENCRRITYDRLDIFEPGILRFSEGTLQYNQLAGLVLRNQSELTRSKIEGCNGRCVALAGEMIVVKNDTIRNGGRLGQWEGAISIMGRQAWVTANLVENSGRAGIMLSNTTTENVIISRNLVRNSGLQAWFGAGIHLGAHPNGEGIVDSNLVENVSKDGAAILLDQASENNRVDHNVLQGAKMGIKLQGNIPKGIRTSKNNAIWHNTILPGVQYSLVLQSVGDLAGTRFSNNILTTQPGIQDDLQSSYIRGTNAYEYRGYGATWNSNIEPPTDPLLLDYSRGQYGLRAGSSAIDIGQAGRWSFLGTRPDAGAIEYGTRQWTFGGEPAPAGVVSNPVLGFESADAWGPISWENNPIIKVLSTDSKEGSSSLAITADGYRTLISGPVDQSVIGGTGAIRWWMKVSSSQPNPWWMGQVQIYLECPSRGFWNQTVGVVDLLSVAKDQWVEQSLTLPTQLANAIRGATFSDLRVILTVNTVPGAGALQFDDLRFTP